MSKKKVLVTITFEVDNHKVASDLVAGLTEYAKIKLVAMSDPPKEEETSKYDPRHYS